MKKILMVLLSGILTLSVTAQTITITFNGTNRNRNYQVLFDGTSYYSNSAIDPNNGNTSVSKQITLSDQQLGSHTIKVYRMRNNNTVYNNGTNTTPYGNAVYSNTFQLRQGYDVNISVNGNGQVSFTEKRIRNQGRRGGYQTVNPIDDASFNHLVQVVRGRFLQTSKVAAERDAFNVSTNYFTTSQVRELLLLISSEANRLALAKLAYPKVTDPGNFTQLYDVFNSVASRDDMNAYIRNNPNYNNSGNQGNNNNNNSYRTPMADYQFSQLLQTVNSQYNQSAKYSTVSGAFNNAANYFTVYQVRQLLSVINAENSRLALAKQSYLRVTDPATFSTLYDLFYSQSSRNELNAYVVQNGGSSYNNNNSYRTPMTDYTFSQLLQTVNSQYNQSGKYSTVSGAFNNAANYFTVYQVRQLLNVITSESDRLALAKQSYLRVTDPATFSSLYDLFYSQSSRNELNTYVVQNGGSSTYTNTTTYRTPMTDATFQDVLQKVSNHFLPWDKVKDARAAFNNTSYYFTTSQIRQVLNVISSENDRLELAKLAWSRVTDPSYFSSLYDMFTTQANRDDLSNYVQTHPL